VTEDVGEAGGQGVLRTEATIAERRHSLRDRVHPIPRPRIPLSLISI